MVERDRGTTLLETVVTIALLGLVATVMGFAITTVLRVTPTTGTRIDDARSLQGLTSRFPNDVASATALASNIVASPSTLTCNGVTAAGDNLLELSWTSDDASPVTFVVAYRFETEPDGRVVRRYACSDAAGFNDTGRTTVSGALADVAPTVTATPSLVALDLQSLEGDPIRIEATPRGAPETLPATTAPPTLPLPSTTTSTTTTTTSTTTTSLVGP